VKGREFDEIFDLLAIRVIVDSVKDCYAALGCIHGQWKPVLGRFKDYIAMPKFNLYQSLHTTVIGTDGKPVEVQIRTREMHQRAEWGVAAHWAYKEGSPSDDIAWLNRIVDWQADTSDPAVFMENLKTDLEQDEVFVFSPKGKVVTLPVGSTPVDFAYAIHTEVGHACIGARINGRLVPLDHKVASGDTCEVFTSKVEGAGPSRDWLGFVVSPRARNKIRQWFSRERREDSLESGKDELTRELRRQGLPISRLVGSDTLAKEAIAAGYADLDLLYVAIGEHHVSARSIAQHLAKALGAGDEGEFLPATVQRTARKRKRPNASVHVEGLDDLMVRLSRCCTPVPGDEILGFVTRGRGVSVHRSDCANAVSLVAEQSARTVEVEWDNESSETVFVASIEVKALDRSGLLRDVANAVADLHLNIVGCSTHTGGDRISIMRFDVELAHPGHLDALLRTVKAVESVYDAYRVVPGGGK